MCLCFQQLEDITTHHIPHRYLVCNFNSIGESAHGERVNFKGLVLGYIEDDFYEQYLLEYLLESS